MPGNRRQLLPGHAYVPVTVGTGAAVNASGAVTALVAALVFAVVV